MWKWNDLLLLVVAGYVIYKIACVDGFSLVNLFILVCITVAIVSTALRRLGYGVENKKRQEKKPEEKDVS